MNLTQNIFTGGINIIAGGDDQDQIWDANGEEVLYYIPFAHGEPNSADEDCLCICNTGHGQCNDELFFADCPCYDKEMSFFCEERK
jgi:hypothetical protein